MEPFFLRDPGADGVGVAFVSDIGRAATDGDDLAAAKRAAVAARLGLPRIVSVHQVHGRDVVVVDDAFLAAGAPAPQADAVVTARAGVGISVHTADCVPVALADPAAGVAGVAHAGRQGFVAGVLPAVLDAMAALGARDVTAWVGPHVCGGCYEVPAEMQADVGTAHPAAVATTTWGTPSLDLGAGVSAQLQSLGCRVERVGGCTREDDDLPSHRRDGASAGRLGVVAWLA